MKKFLTLVLALVMVLAIAAPAMAFTAKETPSDESPYELDLYLVEYDDVGFGTFTALPPSDRGYAKNEVVAAVAELYVPKNESLSGDGYETIEFTGENVSLNVADNNITSSAVGLLDSTNVVLVDNGSFADNTITFDIGTGELESTTKAQTYKWLFFAKVTDDDATLSFAVRTAAFAWTTPVVGETGVNGLDVGDYIVVAGTRVFTVYSDADSGNDVKLFAVTVNKDGESQDLMIYDGTDEYTVVETTKGIIFVGAGTILDDAKDVTYKKLMDIFEDDFEDEFGFDWSLRGGVVDKDFFEDFAGSDDLEVSVEIEPWTAYVTVPDNIVVDPPKTGDAASILGFVMIVLAAAAVVAVRKVRA